MHWSGEVQLQCHETSITDECTWTGLALDPRAHSPSCRSREGIHACRSREEVHLVPASGRGRVFTDAAQYCSSWAQGLNVEGTALQALHCKSGTALQASKHCNALWRQLAAAQLQAPLDAPNSPNSPAVRTGISTSLRRAIRTAHL